MITIDASVWVAADPMAGEAHVEAAAFRLAIAKTGVAIHQPAISLVELAASLARRTGDAEVARQATLALLQTPRLVIHGLDMGAAADAARLAAQTRLRAGDAIYVATARRAGTTLVTLDLELLERAHGVVPVMTPAMWMART